MCVIVCIHVLVINGNGIAYGCGDSVSSIIITSYPVCALMKDTTDINTLCGYFVKLDRFVNKSLYRMHELPKVIYIPDLCS